MNNNEAMKLKPAVEKAAKQAERRWNNLLPADDIEQELWLFILTRPSAQEYLSRVSVGDRTAALKMQADSICSKERLDYDYFTGNFTYSPADVRRLLARLTQENRLLDEERIDLEQGLESLRRDHQRYHSSLEDWYWFGLPHADDAARKVRDRAIDKLTDLMNRKSSQRKAERTEGLGTAPVRTTNTEEAY